MSKDNEFSLILSNGKIKMVKVNHDFKKSCFLCPSLLDIYRDEIFNDNGNLYNNPFKIELNRSCSVNEIKNVVTKLFDIFPILSAHIIRKDDVLLAFDGDSQVIVGSSDDADSFISPFNLEKSLSKFLIVENEDVNFLYIDLHQLIFDYNSLNIIFDTLVSLLDGEDINLVDDGVLRQFSLEDFLIDSEYKNNALKFYEPILSDYDNVSDLLPSIKNEKNTDFKYLTSFDIDSNIINSFLEHNSISPNIFFAGVFAYTLSRFTESSKILFNNNVDMRDYIDSLGSVGNFTYALPLIFDCDNQKINSYLKYSSDLINSSKDYVFCPLELLKDRYGVNSNIQFQYLPKIYDCIDEIVHDFSYDLSFFISYDDSINIKVIYSDKYSYEFIKRFVDVYESVLIKMMVVDELGDIDYISSSDLELLDSYNDDRRILDYDDILEAFNDHLDKYPDKDLVLYNDKSYSYAEGAYIADKIAKRLKKLGVKSQDNVAFLTERNEYYMFNILGILSIGGVYVPLDDKYPDNRIKFILDDTDACVVIVSDETYDRVNNLTNRIVLNISDLINDGIGSLDYLPFVSGNLACILYTSGTTGVPKGVKDTRKALINSSQNYIDRHDLDENDTFGLYATISFSVCNFSIMLVVYSGACLSVIPESIRGNVLELNEYFIRHNVTHTFINSQVAKMFLENVNETSLKILITGGEKLGEIVSPKDLKLFNGYGMTELFASVSSIDINYMMHYSSIGFVNSNLKFYVLDDELRRVPIGAIGELYIAGYQVAEGYLNRKAEESYSFIDNLYDNSDDFSTIYRTGDMVRVLPDGSLGIVGRRDSQVKIRGNRVELLEVESVIRELENVNDVTVQTIKNGSNNELVAYIVVSGDVDEDYFKDNVLDYVSNRKPDYMVPSFIVFLDKIPLNINGKVNKQSLPGVDRDSLSVEYVAPVTNNEKAIVNAFENVFNVDKIGVNDDFVKLGGDSLSAIKLIAELEDYNITVADIFKLRTPIAISQNLIKYDFDLNQFSLDEGCPLSESQLNVYLDIISQNKNDSYLIPLPINIPRKYDLDEMVNALEGMFKVHPILEMCINENHDVPYLIKSDKKPLISIEKDLSEEDIYEFLTMPFDLEESLSRFLIVKNDGMYTFFAVFHHLIFDGLSSSIFERDLFEILNGNYLVVDDSFLKVSAFDKQICETNEFNNASLFYESMLCDMGDVGVLLDSVCPDGPGTFSIDLDVDIRRFLDNSGVNENILFTAVFAYTLSRFVGGENVFFNIIDNGRDRFNNYNSIGMFVNTLPLLVNCNNQTISSFMDYMSDLIYKVMAYNYYPYRLLSKNYDINSNILFQFMPDWICKSDKDSNYIFEEIKDKIIENMDDSITDLEIDVTQKGENYSLNINYSDKYSRDFIEIFAKTYKLILQDMIAVNNLSEINYISSSDLEVLNAYNDTDITFEYDDVLDAFNENLERYPDNALVSFMDRSYSYGEGAFIADRLAKRLVDLGVKSQDRVAFLTEPCEYYMFCVLGVLSCGAVYVPLDDKLPDDRISFILDDTEASVVIVSDETYNRVNDLSDKIVINISDLFKENIGYLDYLPIMYGDLACILYTSGTTDVPKGVEITRKSLINVCENYIFKYGLDSNDVYGLFSAIGFDMASFVISVIISAGACLAVVPDDIKLDMLKLNEYFIVHAVSHIAFPTQVGKLFMESVGETSLDVLLVGGEKLGDFVGSGAYRVVDGYGPTESFAFVCSIDNSVKVDSSSVGFVNSNVKVYVLDDEFRRVPVGAVGELYIGGYQLALGYLNRDDETVYAFVDNPFDEEDFGVLYRTGDLVRFLPDGSLGIVGRRDSQVKIRGNRVELSAVEAVIREVDCVDDVTVQTIKNGSNNELVAYVVSNKEDKSNFEEEIRNFVLNSKPDYMVPSYILFIDFVPLTVNGKVNKGALPDVDVDTLTVEYFAPMTNDESLIVDAFKSILNQERIGVYDDFVRLGGDSISAIRVITFLQNRGVSCSARDILKYKTPSLIAKNLEKFEEDIVYDVTRGEVDLLPIQSFFFDEIFKNSFSQYFILKCKFNMDVDVLQRSLDELFNIHDMLRAVFREDGENGIVQEVLPVGSHVCDVIEYSVIDFNKDFNQIFVNSVASLDIYNKLVDVSLIHCGDEEYVLFDVHHLIVDGMSWNIILDDLTYIYDCLVNGKAIDLLRPYPYKLWVEDVKVLVDNISDEEKEIWKDVNALLDDSDIRGQGISYSFNADFDFDVDNLFMLTEEECWALAIARAYKKTYARDIIFNRESYGRDDKISNLNRTVGWFTSQYPVPVNVSKDYDNLSFIQDVYNIKKSFNDVNNLGLNYLSLIYITEDLDYKHCPVSFNFLSDEFIFENDLFKCVNNLGFNEKLSNDKSDDEVYGIIFNILKTEVSGSYVVSGSYARDTYIGDKYQVFVENIIDELEFIAGYDYDKDIICCLSESQMGVYLDEVVNDKDVAYSTATFYDCDLNSSVEDMKEVICSVVDKHPILKGRILNEEDNVFLICDSYPLIDVVGSDDTSSLIRPFDLEDCLARFYIIDTPVRKAIFFDIHHIISDATTRSIIIKEFDSGFEGTLDDDGVVDLGFVRSSLDDFISKFDSSYENAHRFFANILSDVDSIDDLMADVDGFEGSVILPIRGIKNELENFAYDKGVTVGNLFYGVFAYCLSRFTGGCEVSFNITEHGRHADYIEDSVGMFVRTVPLVVDCKDSSVDDYVVYVSDLVLDAMECSVYPFRLLASEFNLNNNISFEYNYDLNDMSFVGDEIIIMDYALDTVSEFFCVVNDLDDGYAVSVSHSDKYSLHTAKRFVYVFKEILTQLMDIDYLGEIDYICSSDLGLLNKYNDTAYTFDYVDVLDAFNDNLAKSENKVLVGYESKSFTYGVSAFIANEIAGRLGGLGVARQDFVALFVERSEWYLLASLGVLSMGGVYVPIDTDYPDERIVLMLKDTGSKVVLVSDGSEDRMCEIIRGNGLDIDVLNVDVFEEDIGSLSHLDNVCVDVDDVACVLYTSGTTGIPKGVLVTRRAINNFVLWYVDETNFSSDDVYGMHCSYVFDIHTAALYAPVVSGGSLCVVPGDIRLDLKALNDYFVEHGCTHTYITSQVGKLFAESGMDTSIKLLCFGGMKLGELNAPDSIGPFETYGPSENLAVSTSIFANKRIDDSSIGYFVSNVKGYVLDSEGRRVPLGAVGELYLSGAQLTKGYLNRDDENFSVFFDNIFDDEGGYERIYKTGDMVRFLPDGSLGFVGRRDSQVKIRGNRVELGEVESVIRSIGFVEDVTVQTADNNGNNELVAYVVLHGDDFEGNLREFVCDYVANCKPDYMVPSYVIGLDEIPLTVNGKVNHRALPEVDFDSLFVEYVAPRSETEEAIVDAFVKVFGRDNIGVYDDFVRLGGDSLSAIKLLGFLDGFNISAGDVLSLRTPSAIAGSVTDNSFDLDIYSLDSGCPLNEPQLNVYLDINANDKKDSYLIPLFMNISSKFDIEDIRSVLDVMFDVHPVLGMCVSDDFELPYLVKGSNPSVIVESDVNDDFITAFLTKPFDLYDSLSRFLIVEGNDGWFLYAVFHHIIFDAISEEIFKRDLYTILRGDDVELDDSFLRTSAFSQQIVKSSDYNEAGEFYDSMLVDVDDVGELLDSVLADGPGSTLIDLDIDNNLLNSFLENHNVSLNVLFSGVFAYTLSRFVGSEKVLFNIVENGRDRFGNYDSIGMFINTLPLLVDCKDQDIGSFVEYVSDLVYGVMRYNYYSFRLLANKYDIKPNILFQFLPEWFMNDNDSVTTLVGVGEDDLLDHMGGLNADLSVRIIQKGNDFLLSVVYSAKYSGAFINSFVESYKLILKDMLRVKALGEICYVSYDDLVLLDEFNDTGHNLLYDDVLDAFNANLDKYPDNNLVSYNDKSYSYSEGAFIADMISKSLADLGVVSGDVVGFLVPRSELYMFSVLGILSCGGVFVPLDDTLPDNRIRFILEDSDCKFVIVSDDMEERLSNLGFEGVVLNISDIMNCDNGSLSNLPVIYGDVASILYTSGSTGIPKGVKISRKALVNVAAFYVDTYGLSCDDVYGLYPSIGFDAGCESLFKAVYAGACLSVVPGDLRFDMLELNSYFVDQSVTHTMMTTQVGKLFMDSVGDTSLDYLFVGGEKLGEFESISNYVLVDEYGPTETNNFITSVINSEKIHFSSIGHLNYNSKAYVLDNECRRVPLGAVGELYLAGDQLTKGYLNRDVENSNVFFDNPFDDERGYERIYKTGDMVRFLPDGSLGIVGRRDNQLKVRGNRVELGEVESVIRSIGFVEDVTVQTVDNNGNNELVAYVVVSNDEFEGNLRDFVCNYVASRKPGYMVPSFVVELDEVPLTVNGKVDKGALPDVDFGSLFVEYVAPRSETEGVIVDAFEKVFNREYIGVYDDFVRLGGDSLSAIKLLGFLDGFNISAGDVLSLRTPSAIADHVSVNSFDLDVYSCDGGCPLTESQLNVYLDIKANDKRDSYLIPLIMDVSDEYDSKDIRSALGVMFHVHPVLGMCVSDDYDVPYLVKGSRPSVTVESGVSDDFVNSFLTEPFDLYDSLSRFLVVEEGGDFVLYAVFHHIIFDAISEDVFKRDLFSILEGKVVDVDNSFLKASAFNQQIAETSAYTEAEEFYDSMLVDIDDAGELLDSVLADGPGSTIIDLDIDKDLLNSFLVKHNSIENVFFSSVFAYTLSRFVGSEKVLFNIVDNGRDRFNNFDSIGMFVNTLPLLLDCKNQDIKSFVEYVSDVVYGVKRYNYYPYRLLANKYDIKSNIIFQFLPDWIMDTNKSDDNLSDFDEGVLLDNMSDLIADLSVEIILRGNDYLLRVVYCDKYSEAFINRFVQSYKFILNDMLKVKALGDICYVSGNDLIILDGFNDTCHDLLYDDVLDAFNDNLVKYPDHDLVSYNGKSYSYEECAFIADKIAKSLSDLGVASSDCVGFLVPRSELYMFSVLSILSYGGVYVPLDDKLPDERIKFILEDTGCGVVIVSDETYPRAVDLIDDDVVLLNISHIVNGEIGCLSNLPISYGDLACILYTSGTTGIPKGVKITRKAIVNVCEDYIDKYGLDECDVYGLFTAIGFDMSSFAIGLVLCSGACLAVIPYDIRLDMLKLNEYFVGHDVSHTYMTAQISRLFVECVNETSLDVLLTGGEKLGDFDSPGAYRLVESYGPTEAFALVSSIDVCDKLDYSSVGSVNFNDKFYVLDNELRRVPVGAIGELFIGGYQLADGYLNRVEETSDAFVANPFDGGDYGVLYRTGDMCRFLPDGSIAMLGRRDGQVKVRGNRIELGEVESVIRSIDFVLDVTVQTVDNEGNNELVAYIVLSDDVFEGNLRELICDYVAKHKPAYMVPSYVVELDDIPLTVNGKVDKGALPDVDFDSLFVDYVAPRSEIEEAIVDAFEKVFNHSKVGVYDDFVGLGGDSLSAIKLLSYLDLDGFNISAGDVLSLRTPSAIAGSVEKMSFDLDCYSLDGGCPLSESQLNVYLDIKANHKEDAYLIPLFMDISAEFGVEDICSALGVMFDVHPVLGMCVSDDFDVPYLVKGSRPSVIVESGVSNDIINEFLTDPFDLYDSLSRFLIVEGEDNFILYGVFHHIIFDALSEDVFKRDLLCILEGSVVDLDDSFLRVSAFNRQIAETRDYTEAEEFYDSMLVDVDDVGDLLDCVLADGPGSTLIDLDIDNDLLSSFLEDHNVSLNVLFSGVFAYTLSRFVGSEKVLFNIVENGRDRFANYDSIGMFVNTLPLLVDCHNQDIGSFVDYVSRVVYGVMRYNFYPFRLLANEYDIRSDVIFQFLPEWVMDSNNLDDAVRDVDENDLLENMGDLVADLSVQVIQRGSDYLLSVVYCDKYSGAFVDRFVESYKFILNDMLCVGELGDICYVSSDDLVLLDAFNGNVHDLLYDDVLDAFNANLVKCPDNVLVSYNDNSYSYGEGAFVADKVASCLKALGVEVQDNVAFLVERSELYMFCVLGVLSCGGVYVPLDDKLPDDRLSFILEDTGCGVVIVSDETYGRVVGLVDGDVVLLNISDIVNGDVGCLDCLSVVYGDLACILYTSGTTGVPKGVKVTRKSLINVCENYIWDYGLDSDDVYGLFASIGFDMGNFAVNLVLCAGACLDVIPDDIRLDMLLLNEYFVGHNVTHTFITTQVGKLFVENVGDTCLDVLLVAGESLGDFTCSVSYRVVDAYGPAESFAFVSSIDCVDKLDCSSVGFVNFNVKVYVLDDELRRVPVGAVGEIFIAGYQLADGYLNRVEENSGTFVVNPFDDGDYGVLYRTGDVGRFLSDGSLGVVGRRDGQVKVRGNRVELGEVESIIRSIGFVEDVTVQTVDNNGNNELVAYVVVSGDGFEGDLREFVCDYVAGCKPDYMVPSFVVELDEVPLTVNGKVDKGALPDVDFGYLVVEYVAPTNQTEEAVVSAFEIVFNQKGIGLNDDFVRLGGDSISAIRLISLLEKDGISCSARDIYKAKTPHNIAKIIDNSEKAYGFELVRVGTINQSMFLLPPAGGLALVYNDLINKLDFEGNIYVIDDYQFELSLDEIRNVDGPSLAFEKYWNAIKDVFQDGDILVGYSLGCLHASLLCERLENYKNVEKCVLIDGTLNFINDDPVNEEEISSAIKDLKENYLSEINDDDFEAKIVEVFISNHRWNLPKPKVNTHVIYLSISNNFKEELDEMASDYEIINIDSTHIDIITKEAYKILKYLT